MPPQDYPKTSLCNISSALLYLGGVPVTQNELGEVESGLDSVQEKWREAQHLADCLPMSPPHTHFSAQQIFMPCMEVGISRVPGHQ